MECNVVLTFADLLTSDTIAHRIHVTVNSLHWNLMRAKFQTLAIKYTHSGNIEQQHFQYTVNNKSSRAS